MPKRSNEFQQLVYLIQRQLADRPDTVVTESKMLVDRVTGNERETDIVVEIHAHGTLLIVAFECRDRLRKPTIEWVEQQIQKHAHLSDKLVLVANKPFTAKAADLARRYGVDTIELAAAATTDWPAALDKFKDLWFASFDFTVKQWKLHYHLPPDAQPLDQHQPITASQGAQTGPVTDVITSLLRSRESFAKPVMDAWTKLPLAERKDAFTVTGAIGAPMGIPIMLTQGSLSYEMKNVEVEIATKVGRAPLMLGVTHFMDVRVTHGSTVLETGSMAGKTVRLVMTERAGELPKATLTVSGGGQPPELHAAQFATESPTKP